MRPPLPLARAERLAVKWLVETASPHTDIPTWGGRAARAALSLRVPHRHKARRRNTGSTIGIITVSPGKGASTASLETETSLRSKGLNRRDREKGGVS